MATPPRDIAFDSDLIPFRMYTDGSFDRLDGEDVVPPALDSTTGVSSKDVQLQPNVSARLYIPNLRQQPNSKLPILLYFHGGGFCIETPFSPLYHPYLNALSFKANVLAVSVHYRRAPEHPVDTCYQDCWEALQWVASHSEGCGPDAWLNDHGDFRHMYLAGDSAGGNIAHHMAMRAGREGVKLEGVVLVQPYFWGKERLLMDAGRDLGSLDRFWSLICPEAAEMGCDDARVNVVRAGGMEGLGCERVLVCVAEKDPLRGRGWEYYEALGASGWGGKVEIWESVGETHVFHLFHPSCENAAAMMERMASFLNGS